MRFEIGQNVWVMWADHQDGWLYPFYTTLQNFDKVEKWPELQFRKMNITEHHRVRGEWDNNDATPAYDGFVAVDEKGSVWHNQYPICHTGSQTSDGPNHIFSLSENGEEGQKLLAWFKAEEKGNRGQCPVPASMARLDHELAEIRRAVYQMETGDHGWNGKHEPQPERAAKLREWLNHILDSFGRQTGLSVIEEPHPMRELKGWYRFRVEEAVPGEA